MRHRFTVGFVALILGILCASVVTGQVAITHLANSAHHEAHRKYVEEKAREFAKLHPDITIDIIASPGNYIEKILVAAAGGVSYDVVEPTSAAISEIAGQNLLLDHQPFM